MTATILKFPGIAIRPDIARCEEAVAICEGDPAMLLFLAYSGIRAVREKVPVNGAGTPEQVAIDRLAISFFALAELLGATEFPKGLLQ